MRTPNLSTAGTTLALVMLLGGVAISQDSRAAIVLDATSVAPRPFEQQTESSIVRDYGRAWETLQSALQRGDASLLGTYFTGTAKESLSRLISTAPKAGLRLRYAGKQHQLKAIFFAPAGDLIQLQDTAQIEMQYYAAGKSLYAEPHTAHLLVLMTPGSDRWMIRSLQEIPPETEAPGQPRSLSEAGRAR